MRVHDPKLPPIHPVEKPVDEPLEFRDARIPFHGSRSFEDTHRWRGHYNRLLLLLRQFVILLRFCNIFAFRQGGKSMQYAALAILVTRPILLILWLVSSRMGQVDWN